MARTMPSPTPHCMQGCLGQALAPSWKAVLPTATTPDGPQAQRQHWEGMLQLRVSVLVCLVATCWGRASCCLVETWGL